MTDADLAAPQSRADPEARAEAEPRVADVVRTLEEDILFGRLKPRERLVEDQLMARFGAKRYTVRQALSELAALGIVVRAPNRGAAVRDFTAREVEEIYEIRALLQARAAERMPLPAAPEIVADLVAIQRRHDAAVAAHDLRAIDGVNEAFHRALFAACGSTHLADAIGHYAYLTRAMRLYPMADSALLEQLRGEHWAMIHAIQTCDRRALVDLVVRHLAPSKKAYLAVRATVPS